jgi:hypothetical protein
MCQDEIVEPAAPPRMLSVDAHCHEAPRQEVVPGTGSGD